MLKCHIHNSWYEGKKCPQCANNLKPNESIPTTKRSEKLIKPSSPILNRNKTIHNNVSDLVNEIFFLTRVCPTIEQFWYSYIEPLNENDPTRKMKYDILCEIIKNLANIQDLNELRKLIDSVKMESLTQYPEFEVKNFFGLIEADLLNDPFIVQNLVNLTDFQRSRIIETFELYLKK